MSGYFYVNQLWGSQQILNLFDRGAHSDFSLWDGDVSDKSYILILFSPNIHTRPFTTHRLFFIIAGWYH